MRISSIALLIVGSASGSGCSAALAPPVPPHIDGTVESSGGALGSWKIAPTSVRPVDGIEAIDLVDPTTPGHTLRLVTPPTEPEQLPRGIEETIAPRSVELRVANTAPTGGGKPAEVVLTRDHCKTLDAILRATHGVAFGSARFDCALSGGGQVRGDIELAGGSYSGPRLIKGHLEASDATLAHVKFEPDQGQTDPRGVVFWDRRYPRVVFEVDQAATDASVLASGANATFRVTSTAKPVASFELSPRACRVLKLTRSEAGFVRIGNHQHTLWTGTLDLDCDTPQGGRLVASLEVDG